MPIASIGVISPVMTITSLIMWFWFNPSCPLNFWWRCWNTTARNTDPPQWVRGLWRWLRIIQHGGVNCPVEFVQTLAGTQKSHLCTPQQIFMVFRSSWSFSEAEERRDRFKKKTLGPEEPKVLEPLDWMRLMRLSGDFCLTRTKIEWSLGYQRSDLAGLQNIWVLPLKI